MAKKTKLTNDTTIELFEEAKDQASIDRHSAINRALDSAMKVVSDVLEDPDLPSNGKMFAAKMALDAYGLQEKFKREDEKIKIEKEKTLIERAKLSVPGGPMYQFNQYNVQPPTEQKKVSGKEAKKALQSRKELQAALLEKVSGIPQRVSDDKKDS